MDANEFRIASIFAAKPETAFSFVKKPFVFVNSPNTPPARRLFDALPGAKETNVVAIIRCTASCVFFEKRTVPRLSKLETGFVVCVF